MTKKEIYELEKKKEAEYRKLAKQKTRKELEADFVLLNNNEDFLKGRVRELELDIIKAKCQAKDIKATTIVYVDKFGRKWEKTSIDQIFEALTQKRKIDNVLDYYAFKED